MTQNIHFSTKSRTHVLAQTELFIISLHKLIRNWIEETLVGNYELSSNFPVCKEEE